MRESSPSINEWKLLYDAAFQFKEKKCWYWMWDSDLFGVQNPWTGEIGYCCVMGRAGEHFALATYSGTEGLDGYLRIANGEVPFDSFEVLEAQKCLMASFEDRKFVQKSDYEVMKKLGLKFHGSNAWPIFRNYEPGYHPWYITKNEAKYLTIALQQAINVALRFKDNPHLLTPPKNKEDRYFVRIPKPMNDTWIWEDSWIEPAPIQKKKPDYSHDINEHLLNEMKLIKSQNQGCWEFDSFYSPNGVQDGKERPYYPRMFLWGDHRSGLVFGFHLTKSDEKQTTFWKKFVKNIKDIHMKPKEIMVKSEENYLLLEPITSKLNISLRLVDELPMMEEAKYSMFQFFR